MWGLCCASCAGAVLFPWPWDPGWSWCWWGQSHGLSSTEPRSFAESKTPLSGASLCPWLGEQCPPRWATLGKEICECTSCHLLPTIGGIWSFIMLLRETSQPLPWDLYTSPPCGTLGSLPLFPPVSVLQIPSSPSYIFNFCFYAYVSPISI